ncbi:thioredoxin family protein [Marimonas arenosa]|uniref:Thioredoxin family protein n=1 Tax=Marimonas arenosa TaxID=1795305 RepID=A0AAE3WGS7_9RHOB|nr:thioredoxin family protein [Marimonas arenosa]MDQ2091420.1 thioredoxin family protein [Marimonas arenosa]
MKRFLVTLAMLVGFAGMAAAEIGDDGLHKQPWMRDTFKDLREDLEEANAEGKRLVLFVEQRGCIYCKKMHEEVFVVPELSDYIEENFFVVQMNLHGNDVATDFDGEETEQSALMRKWGILFTPTLIFLPEEADAGKTAVQASVATMPGAFGFHTTYDMFHWVREKRYENQDEEDFQRYHARKFLERTGKDSE